MSDRVMSLFDDDQGPGGPPRPKGSLTVSEVLHQVERALYQRLPDVTIVGEVAAVRPHRNGNVYFDLKDARSSLPAAVRGSVLERLGVTLTAGMRVVAQGRVQLFRPQAKVQLAVRNVEPLGEGELRKKLFALKARLREEGLFDVARKRPLPRAPRTVGVVTSPQGAVLRDIIKVLRRRSPRISIVLSPTRVQGEGAEKDVARAIARLAATGACDVLIVGRGGGAEGDLAAFQSELVVRTIAACAVPVISSVGHETDLTLADLAADVRAATPSHAAELAAARRVDLDQELRGRAQRLEAALARRRDRAHLRVGRLAARLPDPRVRVLEARDLLEDRARVLQLVVESRHEAARAAVIALAARLDAARPDRALAARRARASELHRRLAAQGLAARVAALRAVVTRTGPRLDGAARRALATQRTRLQERALRLAALSPLRVLDRGYALVTDGDGALVGRVAHVHVDDALDVRFADGRARVRVVEVAPVASAPERGDEGAPALTKGAKDATALDEKPAAPAPAGDGDEPGS